MPAYNPNTQEMGDEDQKFKALPSSVASGSSLGRVMKSPNKDTTHTVGVHGVSEVRERHVHGLQLLYSQIPELVLKREQRAAQNENGAMDKTK